jgi:hypothetical protein
VSITSTKEGVNLHEVRADVPDDAEGQARFAAKLRALTWEQMLTANGVGRVILVNELMERDITIDVRVNLAVLRQRIPDAEYLVVEGPSQLSVMPNSRHKPVVYTFTERWQPLPAAVAFWFHQAQQFKRELGAAYIEDDYFRQRDQGGEVVVNWREKRAPFLAGILEFRAPADSRAEPQSAGGILLTRVPDHAAAVPTGAALDALPLEEADEDETPPVADHTPEVTVPRRAPARRS